MSTSIRLPDDVVSPATGSPKYARANGPMPARSWAKSTGALLRAHPEFDETPGKYPQNEGIYCRSRLISGISLTPASLQADAMILTFSAESPSGSATSGRLVNW